MQVWASIGVPTRDGCGRSAGPISTIVCWRRRAAPGGMPGSIEIRHEAESRSIQSIERARRGDDRQFVTERERARDRRVRRRGPSCGAAGVRDRFLRGKKHTRQVTGTVHRLTRSRVGLGRDAIRRASVGWRLASRGRTPHGVTVKRTQSPTRDRVHRCSSERSASLVPPSGQDKTSPTVKPSRKNIKAAVSPSGHTTFKSALCTHIFITNYIREDRRRNSSRGRKAVRQAVGRGRTNKSGSTPTDT